jgi:hypothetical protein
VTVATPSEFKRILGGAAYLLTGLTHFSSIKPEHGRLSGPGGDILDHGNEHMISRREPVFSALPRGMDLLNRQELNKGTAFTEQERSALGLHGLLPPSRRDAGGADGAGLRSRDPLRTELPETDHFELIAQVLSISSPRIRRSFMTKRPSRAAHGARSARCAA